MKYFISLAKLIMVIIWAGLLTNLFFPFPGQGALALYLLLGFMCIMHLIQIVIIYSAFNKKMKLTKSEAVQIFIFGVFKLWQIKDRLRA